MHTHTPSFLGEADARTFEYWDAGGVRNHLYHYALTAVTDDGAESLPIYFSN